MLSNVCCYSKSAGGGPHIRGEELRALIGRIAVRRFALFLSLALVFGGSFFAGSVRSSQSEGKRVILTGTVYDTNHAAIFSSEVVALGERNLYRTTTNEEGAFRFELPLAGYRIEANAPGFCPRRIDLFRPRKSLMQRPLDFVLEVKDNDRPCKQKTMLKPPKKKPEPFRRIAE